MTKNPLNEKAYFELYAARHYNNPRCLSVAEFKEDLRRFSDVKRLLKKYVTSGELQERLILNTITIIGNVFTVEIAVEIMNARIDAKLQSALSPFLIYLNMIPENKLADTPLDLFVVNRLRQL
jgi:hypothetical protein